MIFQGNIDALNQRNINLDINVLLEKYQTYKDGIIIEASKSGLPTLQVINEEKEVYIHSKYDPMREAEIFVKKLDAAEDYDRVLFYGIGLGYHIEAFVLKYPEKKVYIYEPRTEILYNYLSTRIIDRNIYVTLENIFSPDLCDDIGKVLTNLFNNKAQKVLIAVLPSYESAYAEDYREFYRTYGRYFDSTNISHKTRQVFEKLWLSNAVQNFRTIINSPNVLYEGKRYFKGKPAILVSAGPSLDEEVENLKRIKENKMAYIFAAGSSINTLVENNVMPDAVISIDPSEHNHLVLKKLEDTGDSSVPLIFGTTVGNSTLNTYKGPILHFITNADSISPFYLRFKDGKQPEVVNGGGSVAVVALDLLRRLGFNPIILVGQNLGYKASKYYAKGIDYTIYGIKDFNKERYKNSFIVPGACGEDVYTNVELNKFREDFEELIKTTGIKNVINTTKGGAHIAGTEFKTLENMIEDYLSNNNIQDFWDKFEQLIYDKESLLENIKAMENSLNEYIGSSNKLYRIIEEIDKAYNSKNIAAMRHNFIKLQDYFTGILNNDFFKAFIYPVNLYQCRMLTKGLKETKNEGEFYSYIIDVSNEIRAFLNKCSKDINVISNLYDSLNKVVL